MKIYEFAANPSSRRVGIFLKELGIEVDRVQLNVREGANLNAEYQEKSVNGKVPMLELDDGTCISETIAICRFFAEKHNDTSLFGTTPEEKGLVEMWQRIVEFDGCTLVFRHFAIYRAFIVTVNVACQHGGKSQNTALKSFYLNWISN